MITYTEADLEALKEALVSGASEVSIGDRRVKYKSHEEIVQAMKIVQASLDAQASKTTQNNFPATFSKGQK